MADIKPFSPGQATPGTAVSRATRKKVDVPDVVILSPKDAKCSVLLQGMSGTGKTYASKA